MKKIITWILLAAMLLGMFAGCGKSEDPTQPSTAPVEIPNIEATEGENNAADVTNYLKGIYKDSGAKTAGNFQRFGIVRIAGVPYEVVWTVDVSEDLVKIIVNDDGTVTIDVNEKCPEDTIYTLTATVTDDNGNVSTATWEYLLPGTASLEEMQATVDEAYALDVGAAMTEERVLSGVIKSIDSPWSDQYQNISVVMLVKGRESKPILCYRLKGEGAKDLVPGDTITVQGIIKNYKGTIEFDAGCQLVTVEKTGTPVEMPSDPHEIMEDVYALGRNEALPYGPVTLTGPIISIDEAYTEQYKNITVTIRVDWYTIKCYRMTGAGVENLEMNDIITVQGYIKNYNGTREFDKPTLLNVVKVGGYPQPTDPVEVVQAAYNLDAGWTLPYCPAVLTGTVTKINTSWSDQYGNVTVTMVVPGAENMPIKCYRMTYGDANVKKTIPYIMVGDTITVEGSIINYQDSKSGKCTVEYNYPKLIKHNSLAGPFPEKQISVEDGDYVIWSTNTNKALQYKSGNYGYPKGVDVTLKSNGELLSSDVTTIVYTITNTSDKKFTVQDYMGRYLGLAGTYNSFNFYASLEDAKKASASCEFIMMEDENGQQYLMNAGKKKFLQYSTSYSSFGCYGWPNADGIMLTSADKLTAPQFVKVTSASDVTSAKYVMVVTTGYAPIVLDGSWLSSAQPTIDGDVVTDAKGGVWTVSIDGDKAILTDANGKTVAPSGGNTNGIKAGNYVWNLVVNANGTVSFKGTDSDTVTLAQNTNNETRFRAYKNATVTGSYADSYKPVFTLYKLEGSDFDFDITVPEGPTFEEMTISNIGDALKASSGDFKVKGVVTCVDGSNIYVQDATGAICVRMPSAPADIALGDTIIAAGSRSVYNGLPQLGDGQYEKSSGLTLSAKETTIGALTTADICTYVKITGLTVTEVYDNNGGWSSPNITFKDSAGKTIQLYKAVTTKTDGAWDIKVGDVIDITCAVGYSNKYQLRNTVASELTKSAGSGGTTPPVTPEEPVAKDGNIAQALAATEGELYKVKGVVTLLDSKNVYMQDSTGGICVRMSSAPTDLSVGDTIIGTGSRLDYNGLPQLDSGTYEKSSGMTLSAKETTIGALTTADICTYVTIKDVTVTEVYDNNGQFSTPNITVEDGAGNTIQIYKAAVGKTNGAWDVKVGNVLTVTGAVGCNKGNLQLRNTNASEIVVTAQGDADDGSSGETGGGNTGGGSTTTGSYTMIDKVANLKAGEYIVSGYLTSYTSSGTTYDWSSAPYHVWNGTVTGSSTTSNSECATSNYAFTNGNLEDTSGNALNPVYIALVAVEGKANTYYVKVGEQYLYSSVAATNRRLFLGSEPAEWVASAHSSGGIILSSNGANLGTAGATKNLLRSYKDSSISSLKYGLVFFKAN